MRGCARIRYKKGNVDGKLMLSSFLRGSGGNQSVKGRKASLCREAKAAGEDDEDDDDDEEEDDDEGENHEWRS